MNVDRSKRRRRTKKPTVVYWMVAFCLLLLYCTRWEVEAWGSKGDPKVALKKANAEVSAKAKAVVRDAKKAAKDAFNQMNQKSVIETGLFGVCLVVCFLPWEVEAWERSRAPPKKEVTSFWDFFFRTEDPKVVALREAKAKAKAAMRAERNAIPRMNQRVVIKEVDGKYTVEIEEAEWPAIPLTGTKTRLDQLENLVLVLGILLGIVAVLGIGSLVLAY